MKVLLFIISLIQTIIGIVFINMLSLIFTEGGPGFGVLIFLFILAVLLSFLVVFKIRKYEVWLPAIVEVILTPIALPRYFIGLIISLTTGNDLALEYDESELLSNIVGYTLYIEISESMSLSKGGNFVSILLFAFPVSVNRTASVILATNRSFDLWPELFGDVVLANTLLDRLIEKCQVLDLGEDSYRVAIHQTI